MSITVCSSPFPLLRFLCLLYGRISLVSYLESSELRTLAPINLSNQRFDTGNHVCEVFPFSLPLSLSISLSHKPFFFLDVFVLGPTAKALAVAIPKPPQIKVYSLHRRYYSKKLKRLKNYRWQKKF